MSSNVEEDSPQRARRTLRSDQEEFFTAKTPRARRKSFGTRKDTDHTVSRSGITAENLPQSPLGAPRVNKEVFFSVISESSVANTPSEFRIQEPLAQMPMFNAVYSVRFFPFRFAAYMASSAA